MGDMVSVVIPVYNTSKYVLDTIKSVIDQNYKNIEIIVINDGSTDDSMIKIESKYGKYINLIDLKKNLGVSNARNIGIRESKGSYIAFIDSDDLWVSDKINKQVSVFENNDKIGVCYTGRYIIKKNGVIIKNENKLYGGDVFNKIIVRNFICLSSVIVRRECFDYCGFFDETLKVSEDYDLWIRISSSYNFFCINEPMVYYRITPNSLTKDEKKMIINAHYVFLKNTLDPNFSEKVNFFSYVMFYSDTFKTTAHVFYDNKKYKSAFILFYLSFIFWPFRIETCAMLIKAFFRFLTRNGA